MKRYQPAFKQVIKEDAEEDKSIKAVKDLIDLDWEKDEDSKHRAIAMIDGLFNADTKIGDAFLKKISDFTSGLNVDDFKEGCKKKPKKKDLKESLIITNKDSAWNAINEGVHFLSVTNNRNLIAEYIPHAIYDGLLEDSDDGDTNEKNLNLKLKIIINGLKEYLI